MASPDYLNLFRSFDKEAHYRITAVEGAIPEDLSGTFLRNGPGLQKIGTDELALLDGYSLIAGLSFKDGHATFRARPVETAGYKEERQAGRQTLRHIFTNHPSRWRNLGNIDVANSAAHDVYEWGGRVFASDGPGHYALNSGTLETLGPDPVFGIHRGKQQISPMPRWDPKTNRMIFYTTDPGPMGTPIKFHEIDAEGSVQHSMPHKLPAAKAMVHDLAFTDHYYVVIQWAELALSTLLWGKETFWNGLQFHPDRMCVLSLLPRHSETGRVPIHVPLPQHFAFHMFNAFERDGRVVVDIVRYPGHERPSFGAVYPPALREKLGETLPPPASAPRPYRVVVNLERGGLESIGAAGDIAMEAPAINPAYNGRPYRYGYAPTTMFHRDPDSATYFFFDSIGKLDFETGVSHVWSTGHRVFVSPPAFAPRPNPKSEDDGWLLTWAYDAGADLTKVAILDALDIRTGPVAMLHLAHALPAVSHVEFTPKVLFH